MEVVGRLHTTYCCLTETVFSLGHHDFAYLHCLGGEVPSLTDGSTVICKGSSHHHSTMSALHGVRAIASIDKNPEAINYVH